MAAKSKNKTQDIYPVYVVSGKDKFLVDNQCESLIASLLDPDERAMGLLSLDADKVEVAEVLDELRTLPFLASRRVVLVKDADDFISANRAVLEKYMDSPSTSGSLILRVNSWRSNTKLAKKVLEIGQHIALEELKKRDLAKFASDHAKHKFNKNINPAAANLIVELVGDEPGRISSEIDKLAVFVDNANDITEDKILELIGNNREFDVFGVIDSMTSANSSQAVSRLRNMFVSDNSAEYKVVGAFAFHFRRMFNAKIMTNKRIPTQQIANSLRIFGDRNSYFRQLAKWSVQDISKVIQALARIDYESKTGQTSTKSAIEQLVIKASLKMARR